MRILIVEDDPAIALPLRKLLQREGCDVRVLDRGSGALELAETWKPQLVLLDIQLPDADGRDIARALRSSGPVPIIMVTGRGEVADKVEGLDAGATDYIVKPFHPAELLARVRAATRLSAAPPSGSLLMFRDLTLDVGTRRVFRDGLDLGLTGKEFELLRMLAGRPGEVVSRSQLIRSAWGLSSAEGANTLDVHLSWLRKKLGDDPKAPRYIETIRGVGLRLILGDA